jgi:branched-chain amino acid transport system substrate-binding protein
VLVKAEDDSCMAEKAVEAAKKLVEAGPHAVLGPVCSTAALAALGVYQEAEIVVISPSATEVSLTRSGRYPLFFRTIAPDDAQARLLADFAVNFLNARRIAIVSDSGVYDTMQAGFAAAFLGENPDLAVAAGEFFGQTQVNWQEIAERAALFEAQALIFFGHPADGAKMLAAMRRQGMETAFVADQRIAGPEFAKQAGEYSPGVYACLLPDVSEIPLAEKLVMEYRDIHFIEPCPFYLNAHAAVQALFEALENSGCRKGSGLADALRAGKVATSLGNTGFDENGDIVGHGFAMHSLKDGRFVVMPF